MLRVPGPWLVALLLIATLACNEQGDSDDSGGSNDSAGSGGSSSACTPSATARAHNPLVSHIFTADPSAKVFGERVYVYTSHDADGQTDYHMVDYHAYSSDDLVNWQDHGAILSVLDVPWATYLYAPDVCAKNGQYFLYFPDRDQSIGVAVSDRPGGPFVDARGAPLVTRSTPGVEDVDWIFDPTCFVDTDGQAYLYFGGGQPNTGDNARVIRLHDDMVSLADARATTIVAPAFFEASFLHKQGDLYYFSYSTTFEGHAAYLDYMTSTQPMGDFTYRGTILTNGSINTGNNSHGSIATFGDRTYLFYHNRKLELDGGGSNHFQRSIAVQELHYEGDAIAQLGMSDGDVTVQQLRCLNGFTEVEAERMAAQSGIEVEGDGDLGVRIVDIDSGDWLRYSQVDFRGGANTLALRVVAPEAGGTVDVRVDGCGSASEPGTSLGVCDIPSTAGEPEELTCTLAAGATAGPHDLCLVFGGSASFELDSFHLE